MIQQEVCPNQASLHDHLSGLLSLGEEDRMIAHLDTCTTCQATLVSLSVAESSILETARQVGLNALASTNALTEALDRLKSPCFISASTENEVLQLLRPSENPESLGRLSHYELFEVIGRGGMGIVFRALDTQLQRTVAIKVVPSVGIQPRTQERFLREAQAAAAVRHENVVVVHSVESDQGLLFLVMEHVPGITLQEWVEQHQSPKTDEICVIGAQIAQGLAAAHEQGLIHRDIKPSNILLTRVQGLQRVKIMDFGLARALRDPGVTHPGMLVGTPAYMSPEQATGRSVDYRTDLFSLGSVLYAMCTGQPPFMAEEVMAVLGKVAQANPPPAHELNAAVPLQLSALIQRLHSIEPERRPASAQDVADELAALQSGKVLASRPWWKKKYLVAAGILLVTVAYLVLPQVIVRIRDKDGRTQEVKVPAGSTVEIMENGKVVNSSVPGIPTSSSSRRFIGHNKPVHSVVFSSDGLRVLSGGWDHHVRLWDTLTGQQLHDIVLYEPGKNYAIYTVAISHDGRRALAGSREGRVWLIDLDEGKVLQYCDHPKSRELTGYGVNSVTFSPDSRQALLGSCDGIVRLWDIDRWREVSRFQHPARLWSVAWSSRNNLALTAGAGLAPICLWELGTGKQHQKLLGSDTVSDGYWHSVFSADSLLAASAGGDNQVRLWDLTSLKKIKDFSHPQNVNDACFTADGKQLLSACQDGVVRLWDTKTGKELHRFAGHSQGVQSVAITHDGRYAVSGGSDGTVQLWELPK